MQTLIWPALNLGILIAIFFKFLRQPIRQAVAQRHSDLRDELKKVRELLQRAQERHDEFSAKLKSIDVETTSLREQAKQDAQAAKLRILSEAQRTSASVVTDARAGADHLVSELKTQLFSEVGVRVVNRAEALIRERLTGDDRARIRQEFSSQLERAQ